MKFDFRTKLLVIVLTMSLVAVLTSDIWYTHFWRFERVSDYSGLWQADNKIFDRLRYFYRVEVAFRRTGDYHSYAGNVPVHGAAYFDDGYGCAARDWYAAGRSCSSFKKIHAPNGIALPVTFMLRFFPTVRSEFSDVFSSLRLRKLLSWKHPLDAMEYIVTPVIFRSSRIAEELAASAESRGISNPGKHTCRRKIEFQKEIGLCAWLLFV